MHFEGYAFGGCLVRQVNALKRSDNDDEKQSSYKPNVVFLMYS